MLSALSRQPYMRPGKLVRLSKPAHGIPDWQVAGVAHVLRGTVYDNDVTLLRGNISWHPELPLHRPPAYVTALVDGGADFDLHQPVPRDRLGRIKVSFPFAPTPTGQEALELMAADSDDDGRITIQDFTDEQIQTFTDDQDYWEARVAMYEAGQFNDPYHGMSDDMVAELMEEAEAAMVEADAALEEARAAELTAALAAAAVAEGEEALAAALEEVAAAKAAREAAEAAAAAAERMATPREELRTSREDVLRYLAYQRGNAAGDRPRSRPRRCHLRPRRPHFGRAEPGAAGR